MPKNDAQRMLQLIHDWEAESAKGHNINPILVYWPSDSPTGKPCGWTDSGKKGERRAGPRRVETRDGNAIGERAQDGETEHEVEQGKGQARDAAIESSPARGWGALASIALYNGREQMRAAQKKRCGRGAEREAERRRGKSQANECGATR